MFCFGYGWQPGDFADSVSGFGEGDYRWIEERHELRR